MDQQETREQALEELLKAHHHIETGLQLLEDHQQLRDGELHTALETIWTRQSKAINQHIIQSHDHNCQYDPGLHR